MIPEFRIWDKIDKETIHVDGIDFERKTVRTADVVVPFAECVLMQSTGLFDKNGVEIFEGDVVKFELPETIYTRDDFDTDWVETIGKIVFNRPIGMWVIDYGYFKDYAIRDIVEVNRKIEVIGNVYENPELVEVTE